jgi:type II secretory pathway component GspD/PulD (secretin)
MRPTARLPSSDELRRRESAVQGIAELPEPKMFPLDDLLVRDDGVVRLAAAEEPVAAAAHPLRAVPEPPVNQSHRAENADLQPSSGGNTLRIPLAGTPTADAIQMNIQGGLVTIVARDAPLSDVLTLLARQQGLNIVTGEDIKTHVTITLTRVPIQAALENILMVAGYTAVQQNNILLITTAAADHKTSSQAQGRVVQVFRLEYTSATDVSAIVKGLLSPAGQSFASVAKDNDNRKTQEVLVVEDMPWNMERIARTIQQLDVAPRQVLIEAHILSVTLSNDTKFGVNLEALLQGNAAVTLRTDGFSDAAGFATPGTSQAFFFNLASQDLNALISALTTTANTKTLASPKVFAVNGQQAKIQIGGQLGFKETTTTQTSTLQSVNFLNVGVILNVTPLITPDNKVLMKVKPEVSTGQIDPVSGLPNTQTTQVETSVLLPDGRGIVIGGLIQESDTDNQAKVPFLGDLWLIGWLFQHRETNRSRNEVIISLIPHIVPYQPACAERECQQFCHSATPLLQGALERYPRPFEPSLPDAGHCPQLFHHSSCSEPPPSTGPVDVPWLMESCAPTHSEAIPLPPGHPSPTEGPPPPPAPMPSESPSTR